jgi:methyl acetate hydrolase
MKDTSLKLNNEGLDRLGKIHVRNEDGYLEATDFVAEQNGEFEEAGGGLYSTCTDYTKFIRMILNDGQGELDRVLQPSSVQLLRENAIGNMRVRCLESVLPEVSNNAEFLPGIPKSWSLGFMRNEAPVPTGRSTGSLAWGGFYNTYYWIDPTAGIGGIYSTQLMPFADEGALDDFYTFEALVYEAIR